MNNLTEKCSVEVNKFWKNLVQLINLVNVV